MTNSISSWSRLLPIALAFAASPFVLPRSAPRALPVTVPVQQGVSESDLPPLGLFAPTQGERVRFNPDLSIKSSAVTSMQEVRFYWTAIGGLAQNQTVSCAFYPTSITPITRAGGIRYIVTGRRPITHNTVVEEWVLRAPVVLLDDVLGTKRLSRAGVRSRTVMYDAKNPGREMVEDAWRDAVNEDLVFLQFWDSQDIWGLDLGTGVMQLKASSTNVPGALLVPDLAAHSHRDTWSRNHGAFGAISVMECDTQPPGWLVLEDLDRDGGLDSYVVTDEASWEALGLSTAANYLD